MKNLKYFSILLPFVLLLAFGCDKSTDIIPTLDDSPITARSAIVTHNNFSFIEVDTIMSPCTNELIAIYAEHLVVTHAVISGNGHMHLSIHDHAVQAEMTGLTTGWDYQVNFNQNQNFNFDSDDLPYTGNFHFISLSHVPGIGQTGGFKVHFKTTITPNGDTAVDFVNFEIVCP